ncbi:MAG: hypothetical protein HY717_14195 [Planctomycetes bacterium]|nr:hypothetical protein [Planctomycetota bacterium]
MKTAHLKSLALLLAALGLASCGSVSPSIEVKAQPPEQPVPPGEAAPEAGKKGGPVEADLAEEIPPPASAFDPAACRLILKNFHGGEFRGGGRRYIFWDFQGPVEALAENPFSLYLSRDAGKSWQSIATDLAAPTRQFAWSLPALAGEKVLVRVHALLRGGKFLTATSQAPCYFDSRLPRVFFDGPLTSPSSRLEVCFHARSDALPIHQVECRVAKVPGEEWQLAGVWEAREPVTEAAGRIPLTLADGLYQAALLARDQAGNTSSPGGSETEGTGKILVDTQPPGLKVAVDENKDIFEGGEELALDIRVEDANLPAQPVAIALQGGESLDALESRENREVLARRFPAAGTFRWRVPQRQGSFQLQVEAADLAGNRSTFEHFFRVVPLLPAIEFLTFNRPRHLQGGGKVEIRWQTRLARPHASKVTLEFSRDQGAGWQELASDLDNTGSWTWLLPREDFRGGLLRIRVRNHLDQENEALSAPFSVSSKVPKVRITGVASSE